jgi:hypothetical protein
LVFVQFEHTRQPKGRGIMWFQVSIGMNVLDGNTQRYQLRGDENSLFPPDRPQVGSLAASLLANASEDKKSVEVRADRWFDRDRAEKYYLRESCFKTGSDSVTVILWWEDEQQLIDIEDEEERRASRRSDYREEY